MKTVSKGLILAFVLFLHCSDNSQKNQLLFQDSLAPSPSSAWNTPPDRFLDINSRKVFHLTPKSDPTEHPWVGDSTWTCYRIEIEMLAPDSVRRNFVGLDFHVQPNGVQSNNIGFFVGGDPNLPRVFEAAAHWYSGNVSWKLWPFASSTAPLPQSEWITWRLDIGRDFANIYVNNDSLPVYTARDLPFSSGGVRLWEYNGSALFRNLKITRLDSAQMTPLLPDPWAEARQKERVQNWQISRVYPQDISSQALETSEADWRRPVVDARGIVNVTATYPQQQDKGTVYATGDLTCDTDTCRILHLSYTDQLTVWINDVQVFDGPARGWYDPGRTPMEGFGRLLPDLFQIRINLKAGANDIHVRHLINEPQFGSGFWMGLE
ncbi:MAG: hypothetical protein U5R06_02475 [candidate division KSB1 bacterium]|nr:hypothetical protein [candidate division KSB1 bacterium]